MEKFKRSDFIHHNETAISRSIREVVFGVEDGMVSTLGALTGIAVGTNNPNVVILAGFVIIAVESVSMGVGSYLSNKSAKELDDRKLFEEKIELVEAPETEREELELMYIQDGWPHELAETMAMRASRDKNLFLKEMAHHELGVFPGKQHKAIHKGFFMFISYIVGGIIPVAPYLLIPLNSALGVSLAVTLVGLFVLGVFTTKFTKRLWWKAGSEMLVLASAAALIGYVVGTVAERIIN